MASLAASYKSPHLFAGHRGKRSSLALGFAHACSPASSNVRPHAILHIGKDEYRRDIRRLQMFLEGNKSRLLEQMRAEMQHASDGLDFEQAAKLRDEIRMLESLDDRG